MSGARHIPKQLPYLVGHEMTQTVLQRASIRRANVVQVCQMTLGRFPKIRRARADTGSFGDHLTGRPEPTSPGLIMRAKKKSLKIPFPSAFLPD
jgi:hypothetical protein